MEVKTFFFYDLETSGLNARADRIMQFAGQRTNMDLEPIGEPVNLMVRMGEDVLPSPHALLVTGITPQMTLQDGYSEAEFARRIYEEFFTPDTIVVGYNNVRFDDEFLRYLFWRNFWDPYEWAWKDGRSRWDLLDVVRMTRALRPEGIKWPSEKKPVWRDGEVVEGEFEMVATNRLELITKLNKIGHEKAHDALSDVEALIDVAKLIREKQPQLFEYLLRMREKKAVQGMVNLDEPREFVYVSGRYDRQWEKATVAWPLASGRNGGVVVYDLRYDPTELIGMGKEELREFLFERRGPVVASAGTEKSLANRHSQTSVPCDKNRHSLSNPAETTSGRDEHIMPRAVIKELRDNRCPAVAPIGVLEQDGGWERIGLDLRTVRENKRKLLVAEGFAEMVQDIFMEREGFESGGDAEERLYESFLSDRDRVKCEAVRNAGVDELADFHPEFVDERLVEMLVRYKARNFPKSLSADEALMWETWREGRIREQLPKYAAELAKLATTTDGADGQFVLQELQLWLERVVPTDY